jgi:hypothetical protein
VFLIGQKVKIEDLFEAFDHFDLLIFREGFFTRFIECEGENDTVET